MSENESKFKVGDKVFVNGYCDIDEMIVESRYFHMGPCEIKCISHNVFGDYLYTLSNMYTNDVINVIDIYFQECIEYQLGDRVIPHVPTYKGYDCGWYDQMNPIDNYLCEIVDIDPCIWCYSLSAILKNKYKPDDIRRAEEFIYSARWLETHTLQPRFRISMDGFVTDDRNWDGLKLV